MGRLPVIEFTCKCGVNCRLYCEAVPFGGMAVGMAVQHCYQGDGIIAGGIPISLDVQSDDGTWVEFVRYQ